jgi:hypothetical protein
MKTHADRGRGIGIENLPVTKFELMRELSCFNRENESLGKARGWEYHDSFEGLEEQRATDCLGERRSKEGWIEWQHRRSGCFLAATLMKPDPAGRLEILLTDTSDYWDKGIVVSGLGVQFFGLTGWISSKEPGSQAHWLQSREPADAPALRVYASHYPPEQLGPIFARLRYPPGVVGRLAKMLPTTPAYGQYWLHGHQHQWRERRVLAKGNITAFGVGSTTDHAKFSGRPPEPPHAALVTLDHGEMEEPERIELAADCTAVTAALDSFTRIRPERATYSPVLKRGFWNRVVDGRKFEPGEEANLLLGLDKSYRQEDWGVADEASALQNLASFIDEFVEDAVGARPIGCESRARRLTDAACQVEANTRICLALRSSYLEQTLGS